MERTVALASGRESPAGGNHRFRPVIDRLDDFGVVDPAQVSGRDREVGMPELSLDHDQRDPLAGQLDSVRMAQLVVVPTSAQAPLSRPDR